MNKKSAGFTLIEVMVSIVVLSIGLISFNIMQVSSVKGNADGVALSNMSWVATDLIETFVFEDFDKLKALDKKGTNDGVAGLNDGFPTNAGKKDSATKSDIENNALINGYILRGNVAADYPVPNTMSIRVIAIRELDGKKAVYNFYKADL